MLIEWNIEIYITPLNEREKERKRERVFLHDCEGGLRLPTNFPVVTADSATSGFLSVFNGEQYNLLYWRDHQLFLNQ